MKEDISILIDIHDNPTNIMRLTFWEIFSTKWGEINIWLTFPHIIIIIYEKL